MSESFHCEHMLLKDMFEWVLLLLCKIGKL